MDDINTSQESLACAAFRADVQRELRALNGQLEICRDASTCSFNDILAISIDELVYMVAVHITAGIRTISLPPSVGSDLTATACQHLRQTVEALLAGADMGDEAEDSALRRGTMH